MAIMTVKGNMVEIGDTFYLGATRAIVSEIIDRDYIQSTGQIIRYANVTLKNAETGKVLMHRVSGRILDFWTLRSNIELTIDRP